jgi:geranylgeranyl reductase family protein
MDTDVLVVGAGPAGSIAALILARAGVRVRLVDRARFPRDKLCGDTLNPGSLSILDRLGISTPIRARAAPVTGMLVTGPGARVSADYPHGLCGVSMTRRDLDLMLLNAAIDAGAHVECGVTVREPIADDRGRVTGVRVASNGHARDVRARIVVAADGRGSRLASRLQLSSYAQRPRRWAFGAYFTGVAAMTGRGEMHIRPDGYIGVARLPAGLTNVSVVRDAANLPMQGDQQSFVRDALAVDPELRERFAHATQVSRVSVLGPLAVDSRRSGCAGLLLAGDAAGFVDPMTGDGLRFALRGGELAARAALDELDSGAPAFAKLHASRVREFSGKWRINRALRSIVGSPRALNLAALVSRYWSKPVEYLIGVAGDVNLVEEAGGTGNDIHTGERGKITRGNGEKITRGNGGNGDSFSCSRHAEATKKDREDNPRFPV